MSQKIKRLPTGYIDWLNYEVNCSVCHNRSPSCPYCAAEKRMVAKANFIKCIEIISKHISENYTKVEENDDLSNMQEGRISGDKNSEHKK